MAKDLVWAIMALTREQKEPTEKNSGVVDVTLQIRKGASVIPEIFRATL